MAEASLVVNIWGIELTKNNIHAANPEVWRGLNLLGFALMQVRKLLVENGKGIVK